MTAPLQPRTSSTAGLPTGPPSPSTDGAPTWDPARDPAFFRIVAHLFRPSATLAMTVLLASYDDEAPADSAAPTGTRTAVVPRRDWS